MDTTWMQILKTHGFSTLVALILLGVLLGVVPSPLVTMELTHAKIIEQQSALIEFNKEATRVMRIICYAQTKSNECLR